MLDDLTDSLASHDLLSLITELMRLEDVRECEMNRVVHPGQSFDGLGPRQRR